MIKLFLSIILFFSIISCDKGVKTPEGLLKKYIEEITSSSISKDGLGDYLSGRMLDEVMALDDNGYKQFLQKNKVKSTKIKILNKSCVSAKCTITYVLSYKSGEKKNVESEVKKVAVIEEISEKGWRISEVTNIKTYLNAQEPIQVK